MSLPSYVEGVFIEELKNRFLCLVSIDGNDTLCYIPSSCRLSNFVDLRGKKVMLKLNSAANSRTKYAVYAVKIGGQYILLNLSSANRLIEENISSRRFAFLGKRDIVKHEHKINGYKCDLYIEDSKTIIEIKSILSFKDTASFPSVYSQRAICQLQALEKLIDDGYRIIYIFVSLNPKVKTIIINNSFNEYHELFHSCINKGMICKGYSIHTSHGESKIDSSLSVQTN